MNGSTGHAVPLRSHARRPRMFCTKISVTRRSKQQRMEEDVTEIPDELIQKAEIIVHQVNLGFRK